MEIIDTIPATPDSAILWRDDRFFLLDQRMLPDKEQYLALDSAAEVADAIRDMVVRGAPAIGVTAAFGVVLAARDRYGADPDNWRRDMEQDLEYLAAARPTAVNLFWALRRMRGVIGRLPSDQAPFHPLLDEALAIHREDVAANRRMGDLGASLIEGTNEVITHCNAGALATGGYGTALGVIRSAYAAGKISLVLAD